MTFTTPVEVAPAAVTEPLVSVIIPVFQGERIIAGAVTSALAQTHRNLEIFIVDDGSSDGTPDVLATITDPRVRVLRQTNAGTAAARNHALRYVQGSYVAFLDSDDRWMPEKIATEVATLQRVPQAAVAYSSYYAVDDRGRLLNLAPQRTTSGFVFDDLLDGDDYLMPSLCLFDRRVFVELGSFNTDRYHEDHEFILRVTQRFPIVATGERLAVYRQSTSGKCRAILADFERARREELSLIDDLDAILDFDQKARLRRNVLRSLYCRFLMYGFNDFARRLAEDVEFDAFRKNNKGRLALVFARTGINALAAARAIIQAYHLRMRQGWWARVLRSRRMVLSYE